MNKRSVQGGCSKLMDKSWEVWLQLAVNSYIVRYTARTEQVMSKRSWKEKRQWVHLMVIVEKKAKSEEVWVV
jgi:hypothetical protein